MKQIFTQTKNRGFTLIELVVVIFIIALISTVSIANFRQGQRSRAVSLASDTVISAIRNAQNAVLSSRQILNSGCASGNAPSSYVIYFTYGQNPDMELYGIDKCNNSSSAHLIEQYAYPAGTRVRSGGYLLSGIAVDALQIKFTPPFGSITLSTDHSAPNGGTFSSFQTASIIVESVDGSISQEINVDGLSGKIESQAN